MRRKQKSQTRIYRVMYAVTRSEYYEVKAVNAKEAQRWAFSEGQFIDMGETTNVKTLETLRIRAFTEAKKAAFKAAIRDQITEAEAAIQAKTEGGAQ